MEYHSLSEIPFFTECSKVVDETGSVLVQLQVVPQKESVKVTAVISSKEEGHDIGVNDCAKAHRALIPRMVQLLHRSDDEIFMEVCSPGTERNIKNAAEFSLFTNRQIRVWDKNVSDWVPGKILSSDENQVTLECEEGGTKSVAYQDIAKAKFISL